jgi:uncharacterized protein (DUF934 family)
MVLITRDASGARCVEDTWTRALGDEPVPDAGDVVVELARWRAERARLAARRGRVGVRLASDVDPADVGTDLDGLALVEVALPKFSDGRVYSLARLLRERYAFAGDLRAVGDVLRDQLFFLARCGFSSFELAPGRDPADALLAFEEFSATYQPAADHAQPLWRRSPS